MGCAARLFLGEIARWGVDSAGSGGEGERVGGWVGKWGRLENGASGKLLLDPRARGLQNGRAEGRSWRVGVTGNLCRTLSRGGGMGTPVSGCRNG
jgi:hypothetical protein